MIAIHSVLSREDQYLIRTDIGTAQCSKMTIFGRYCVNYQKAYNLRGIDLETRDEYLEVFSIILSILGGGKYPHPSLILLIFGMNIN